MAAPVRSVGRLVIIWSFSTGRSQRLAWLDTFANLFLMKYFYIPHVHRWLLAIGLVHTPATRNPSLPQFLLLAIVKTILSTVDSTQMMQYNVGILVDRNIVEFRSHRKVV